MESKDEILIREDIMLLYNYGVSPVTVDRIFELFKGWHNKLSAQPPANAKGKYSYEKVGSQYYVWHKEGIVTTFIASTDNAEKAHFLATAANALSPANAKGEEDHEKIGKENDLWNMIISMCKDDFYDHDGVKGQLEMMFDVKRLDYSVASQPVAGDDQLREENKRLRGHYVVRAQMPTSTPKYFMLLFD